MNKISVLLAFATSMSFASLKVMVRTALFPIPHLSW